MTDESTDITESCGECVICQCRLAAAIVNEDTRVFLAGTIEASVILLLDDLIEGKQDALDALEMLLGIMQIFDRKTLASTLGNLALKGIVIMPVGGDDQ